MAISSDAIYSSLVAVVIAVATASVTAYHAGLTHGKALGREEKARELNNSTERDRYLRLYVPLERLFENHILTICASNRYPYLLQRIKRSLGFLLRGRLRLSVIAISDCGFSESAEFECGRDFPINEIENVISENLDIADLELRSLAGAVRRELFDNHPEPPASQEYPWEQEKLLTLPQLSLLRYIHEMYAKLNSRFVNLA